jgi:hypothetical protein
LQIRMLFSGSRGARPAGIEPATIGLEVGMLIWAPSTIYLRLGMIHCGLT